MRRPLISPKERRKGPHEDVERGPAKRPCVDKDDITDFIKHTGLPERARRILEEALESEAREEAPKRPRK